MPVVVEQPERLQNSFAAMIQFRTRQLWAGVFRQLRQKVKRLGWIWFALSAITLSYEPEPTPYVLCVFFEKEPHRFPELARGLVGGAPFSSARLG